LALFVEGDRPAENDQLMVDCSAQEMTLYEVCRPTSNYDARGVWWNCNKNIANAHTTL